MGKKKRSSDRVSDLDLATFLHETRPLHAQEVDEGTLAKKTDNVFVWWADPSRMDFEGVDTPTQRKPKNLNRNNARRRAKREGLI